MHRMVLQLPSFIRYDFVLIEVHFIRTLLLCLPSGSADDGSDSVVYSELFSTFLNISPTIYMPDLLKLITSRFPQVVKLIRRLREIRGEKIYELRSQLVSLCMKQHLFHSCCVFSSNLSRKVYHGNHTFPNISAG